MYYKDYMAWYFIMGILTLSIGIWRNITNKQSSEADSLTVFSWFLLWWVWLPFLIGRLIYFKIIKPLIK